MTCHLHICQRKFNGSLHFFWQYNQFYSIIKFNRSFVRAFMRLISMQLMGTLQPETATQIMAPEPLHHSDPGGSGLPLPQAPSPYQSSPSILIDEEQRKMVDRQWRSAGSAATHPTIPYSPRQFIPSLPLTQLPHRLPPWPTDENQGNLPDTGFWMLEVCLAANSGAYNHSAGLQSEFVDHNQVRLRCTSNRSSDFQTLLLS